METAGFAETRREIGGETRLVLSCDAILQRWISQKSKSRIGIEPMRFYSGRRGGEGGGGGCRTLRILRRRARLSPIRSSLNFQSPSYRKRDATPSEKCSLHATAVTVPNSPVRRKRRSLSRALRDRHLDVLTLSRDCQFVKIFSSLCERKKERERERRTRFFGA